MIYELWVGDECKVCTGNLGWLMCEGLPFHRRWSHRQPILITSRRLA